MTDTEHEVILLVCGSRGLEKTQEMDIALWDWLTSADRILHGDCPNSPDRWVDPIAETMNLTKYVEKYPAKWDELGKKAGYVRNVEMVDKANMVLCFWDGVSKGAKHVIDYCQKTHTTHMVIMP